jgi:hypothetical protein
MDNVKTWLYFNSDDSDDPEDFAIDFKDFCLHKYVKNPFRFQKMKNSGTTSLLIVFAVIMQKHNKPSNLWYT